MPETRSKHATSKATNNTAAGTGAYVDPMRHQNYQDPVKNTKYQDPLRKEIKRYEGTFKFPEFKPYTGYQEYKPPDIDPLTGKPRRKRVPKPKPEPKPEPKSKVVEKPPAKETEPEPWEPMPEPEPEPLPEPEPELPRLPPEFGSSTGSVKRSIDILSNYIYTPQNW